MICPKCKAEYRIGFNHCSDCDVELVDHLPPESGSETHSVDDEPVVVFITSDLSEAALVESLLEGSGAEPLLFDEHLARMDSPLSVVIGGAKVAVPRRQEKLAREVLQEYRGRAGQNPVFGRLAPFQLEESGERFDGGDSAVNVPYRCMHCRTVLEPETTVCSNCGGTPFRELV